LCGGSGHANQRRGPGQKQHRGTRKRGRMQATASQSESGPMRSPMGVRTEEVTLTFSGADREAPPQGPLFKVAKDPQTARAVFSGPGEEDQTARPPAQSEYLVPRGMVPARPTTYRMKRAEPRTEPRGTPRQSRNERPRAPRKRTPSLPSDRKDRV